MTTTTPQTLYESIVEQATHWFIRESPGLLITIVMVFVAFKIAYIVTNNLSKTLIKRAEKDSLSDAGEATKRINTLIGISYGAIRVALWTLAAMMILQKLGVNIGPILASAGILGLAVGFGAQELVKDFISGFFIVLENQVRAGDVAIINGTGGFVEKIQLRTITLRDFSGIVHVFQNGKINTLSNMTKDWSAMVFDIGVAYKEDVQKVTQVMKQVGDEMYEDPIFKELMLEPIEVFGLDNFADSALILKARIRTKPIQQWTVGREYRKRLKEEFDRQNIEIPFPHTTIYWGEKINPLKLDVPGISAKLA
jgi:moderate conductance mechanosensitive channel